MVKIKGHEIEVIVVKDSFQRRVVQSRNKIIDTLRRIGLTEDDVDIPLEAAIKRAPAAASWYFKGHHLHYSYRASGKFVDNLYIVFKVIELEVDSLVDKEKTIEEFTYEFSEDRDVEKQRKEARDLLGISHDATDLNLINKKYKVLAKECHPDMPNGDHDKFKALTRAHDILERELE